jgi:hypothetical protein
MHISIYFSIIFTTYDDGLIPGEFLHFVVDRAGFFVLWAENVQLESNGNFQLIPFLTLHSLTPVSHRKSLLKPFAHRFKGTVA